MTTNTPPDNTLATEARNADAIRSQVREDYARVARGDGAGGLLRPRP
jgi:hypothetical protein